MVELVAARQAAVIALPANCIDTNVSDAGVDQRHLPASGPPALSASAVERRGRLWLP